MSPPAKTKDADIAQLKEVVSEMERTLSNLDGNMTVMTAQVQALAEAARTSRTWDLINRAASAYGEMVLTNGITKAAAGAMWTIIMGALILGFSARWFDVDVMLAFDGMRQATELADDFVGPRAPNKME